MFHPVSPYVLISFTYQSINPHTEEYYAYRILDIEYLFASCFLYEETLMGLSQKVPKQRAKSYFQLCACNSFYCA